MSLEDKCSHDELFFLNHSFDGGETVHPAYFCFSCNGKLCSSYYGGVLDMTEYTHNVVGYSGLRLERTRPKEQLELFK